MVISIVGDILRDCHALTKFGLAMTEEETVIARGPDAIGTMKQSISQGENTMIASLRQQLRNDVKGGHPPTDLSGAVDEK